jgi:uncharacterized membrane-anchored protein
MKRTDRILLLVAGLISCINAGILTWKAVAGVSLSTWPFRRYLPQQEESSGYGSLSARGIRANGSSCHLAKSHTSERGDTQGASSSMESA